MVGEVTIFPAEPATVTVPPTPSAAEDLDLLRQAARGDGQAFHKLVDRHGQSLYRLAVSLAGNSADAEDLVQECLAGAFRGLDRFEGRSSVKTWLTRILVTQVARWRRSRRGKTALSIQAMDSGSGGDQAGETADWVGASGTDPADHVGRQVDVQAALRTLSAEHREVLVLREFQGLAYEEIAEVLGVPRGTVESRLHRARAELRGRLKSYLP
jgi:RNA polymerase sigma-70 factor (ECF subfamily)